MSTKKNHTEWQIGHHTEHGVFNADIIQTKDGTVICQVYGIPMHSTLEEAEKFLASGRYKGLLNAKLIVKAVNCHEELVEALRQVARDCEAGSLDHSIYTIEQIEAALAKV